MGKDEVIRYGKALGLTPVRIRELGTAKHIFSHVEWHMIGYEILVDELEKNMAEDMTGKEGYVIFADIRELQEEYPIPSAFGAYMPHSG